MNDYEKYDEFFDTDNSNNEYNSRKKDKKTSAGSQLLVIIQLIICTLLLISAFVIKTIGGSIYAQVGTWFYDNYNNSVFTDTKDNILSFTDKTKTTENKDIIPQTDNSTENSDVINQLKANMQNPLVKGTVTSAFGNRAVNSDSSNTEFHKGIDISAEKGSVISAMLDGMAIIADKNDSYGNYIVLEHSDNVKTLYAHCSELCIKQGEKVKTGQKIAFVGSSGDADGNHLHLEIMIDGENINPQEILGKEYT